MGHLGEACLFRQRRERALGRRSRAGRELRGADGRHAVDVVDGSFWWKGGNAPKLEERVTG